MSIKFGNLKLVKYLVEDKDFQPSNINAPDINNEYPIVTAVTSNQSEILDYLLGKGALINRIHLNGDSLLSLAINNHQKEVVKCLLAHDIDINEKDISNTYSLVKAIYQNKFDIVRLLVGYAIKNGINLNQYDINGSTPLIIAYRQNHLDIFKFLAKFLNINLPDTNGNPILFYVMANNDLATMKYLINLGANLNFKINTGHFLLDILLTRKNKEIFLFFIRKNHQIPVNEINIRGETLLITLIKSKFYTIQDKLEIIKEILILHKVNVNLENSAKDTTPLLCAMQTRSLELVKLLVQNGADVNYYIKSMHKSILTYAVYLGDLPILNYLIECNAMVNNPCFQEQPGQSPWELALKKENNDIIGALAKYHINFLTGDI